MVRCFRDVLNDLEQIHEAYQATTNECERLRSEVAHLRQEQQERQAMHSHNPEPALLLPQQAVHNHSPELSPPKRNVSFVKEVAHGDSYALEGSSSLLDASQEASPSGRRNLERQSSASFLSIEHTEQSGRSSQALGEGGSAAPRFRSEDRTAYSSPKSGGFSKNFRSSWSSLSKAAISEDCRKAPKEQSASSSTPRSSFFQDINGDLDPLHVEDLQLSLRAAMVGYSSRLLLRRSGSGNVRSSSSGRGSSKIMQDGRLSGQAGPVYNPGICKLLCHRLRSPLDPHGFFVVLWSLCGASVLCYEIAATPLGLIWGRGDLVQTLDLIATVFWSLEILVFMRTAYFSQGELIKDSSRIVRHYAMNWLLFDLLVVVPEWVVLFTELASEWTGSTSIAKAVRAPRMLRLARLVKLARIRPNLHLMGQFASMHVLVFLRVGRWMLILLGAVHVSACLWYFIGDSPEGWVQLQRLSAEQAGWTTGYLASLAWVLCHLNGAAVVQPAAAVTHLEQVFETLVALLCLIFVVLFISNTTIMLQSFQSSRRHHVAVRAFIRRHKVPYALGWHMCKVLEDESEFQEQRDNDKLVLRFMPESRAKEVKAQVWGECMVRKSALLGFLRLDYNSFFAQMLHRAVTSSYLRKGDIVFQVGDLCEVARCVVSGKLQYELSRDRCTVVADGELEDLAPVSTQRTFFQGGELFQSGDSTIGGSGSFGSGHWISEARLWTEWRHCGELKTITCSMMLCVDPQVFHQYALKYKEVGYLLQLYAAMFTKYLSEHIRSDVIGNLPPSMWEDSSWADCLDKCPAVRRLGGKEVQLPFLDSLPAHIRANVCHSCTCIAQKVATDGLPEKHAHHGFTIIVGDTHALKSCGKSGFNILQGHHVCVINSDGSMNNEAFEILWRHAFHGDGAIVVDSQTGCVDAVGWFVGDISKGGRQGGARSRSAKAIAQQAGNCFVIKGSEDSRGSLILHMGKEDAIVDEGTTLLPLKEEEIRI